MKNLFITIFFCSWFVTYSQTNTVSVIKKLANKKYGFSVFGGLGIGAKNFDQNISNNWGYVKTVSTRFHYGIHTINANFSQLTPQEQPVFKSASTAAFNMHNFGLTYGVGTYGKHFSAGCLVGVAYTNITAVYKNLPSLDSPIYSSGVIYNKDKCSVINGCFGLHASVKTKYIGIGYQMYYNIFSKVPSCNASLGIEVTIK